MILKNINKWSYVIVPTILIAVTVMYVMLAWGGDHFPLVALGVISVLSALASAFYAWGLHDALAGWGKSTTNWGAAQEWGMKQDKILTDVLEELKTYDEEAYSIHWGRSMTATLAYLKAADDG